MTRLLPEHVLIAALNAAGGDMREALERIVHLGDTFRYDSDEDVFRLVDDTKNCARAALKETGNAD